MTGTASSRRMTSAAPQQAGVATTRSGRRAWKGQDGSRAMTDLSWKAGREDSSWYLCSDGLGLELPDGFTHADLWKKLGLTLRIGVR